MLNGSFQSTSPPSPMFDLHHYQSELRGSTLSEQTTAVHQNIQKTKRYSNIVTHRYLDAKK